MKFNLFIVGVQKGGTTALATFLQETPRICVPKIKELHLFDRLDLPISEIRNILKTTEDLAENMGCKHLCDATPVYILSDKYLDRIREYNEQAKILVILRDPVERALSQYFMEKNRGREKAPMLWAFVLEPLRLGVFSHFSKAYKDKAHRRYTYAKRSKYTEQIATLRNIFSDDNIFILTNSDLRDHHQETLKAIYKFLGLGDTTMPAPRIIFSGAQTTRQHQEGISLKLSRFILRLKLRKEIAIAQKYRLFKQVS